MELFVLETEDLTGIAASKYASDESHKALLRQLLSFLKNLQHFEGVFLTTTTSRHLIYLAYQEVYPSKNHNKDRLHSHVASARCHGQKSLLVRDPLRRYFLRFSTTPSSCVTSTFLKDYFGNLLTNTSYPQLKLFH